VGAALLVGIPLSFFPTTWMDNIFVLLGMMGAVTVLYLLISTWIGVFTHAELRQCLDYAQGSFERLQALFRKKTVSQMQDQGAGSDDQPKP
jgi:hypothetical protein